MSSWKLLDDMWLILLFYINVPSFMLKAFTHSVLYEFHFHKALTRICHFLDRQSCGACEKHFYGVANKKHLY